MKHLKGIQSYVRRSRGLRPSLAKSYREKRRYILSDPSDIADFLMQGCEDPSCDMMTPRLYDGTLLTRIVDIGFGNGESLRLLAGMLRQSSLLGIEVYKEGIAKLLREVGNRYDNIRVLETSAVRACTAQIPAASIDALHIFFPDPWPKKRHHKRRLVSAGHMDALLRPLRKGGYLYFVSDWAPYAYDTLKLLASESRLRNRYYRFAPRQEWRAFTKYEKKALSEKRIVRELIFDKISE